MDSKFFAIMAIAGVFVALFAIISIAEYILMSIGIQRLLKGAEIENSWLCWLPIINMYALGLLIADKSKIPKIELVMLYGNILATIIFLFGGNNTFLDIVFNLICFIMYVMFIYSIYLLYCIYSGENKILYTVFSIVFPLIIPIFIYSIRDNLPENNALN